MRILILYVTYSVPSSTLKRKPPTKSLSPHQSPRYLKKLKPGIFHAANDTALNTLRPIRPCFTAKNKAYNPPTPHFHYANIAYGTQFNNGLCYTRQFSRIWFSVLQSVLCFSLQLCFSNDVCRAPNSWKTTNQRHEFMAG